MITTIHFEGNQFIKCSYEKNQIIEHGSVEMEHSWDFYVKEEIKKRQQLDDIFLGVLLDQVEQEHVLAMETIRKLYHLTKRQLRLFTKEEAFIGWMEYEPTWLAKGNAGLFDYEAGGLYYYLIQKNGEKISVQKTDVTKYMELSKEEKDIPFLSAVKEVLAAGVTSVVYLTGKGFHGNWMEESVKYLCNGRRVFMGDHIFAQGMIGAYLVEKQRGKEYNSVILTQNGTKHNIYLQLQDGRNQTSALLLKEGMPWMTSKNEITIIVEGISKLRFLLKSIQNDETCIHELKLTGASKDVTKYRIEIEYTRKDQCRIKVYELGFGRIRPSSHRVYQMILALDEGVNCHE
ncbi:MAG: DUF5716 family protein [Anaerostipes sp.]|nr:DUF5716 family protein [Anaerostipes sp.]